MKDDPQPLQKVQGVNIMQIAPILSWSTAFFTGVIANGVLC
jgi:hypothetical protein